MGLNDEVLFLSRYLTEDQLTDFLMLKIDAEKEAMKDKLNRSNVKRKYYLFGTRSKRLMPSNRHKHLSWRSQRKSRSGKPLSI